MKLNHSLENVNISNLSTTNVSSTKLDVTNLSVDTGITTTTLAATGNILTEDSFTFRTDSFTAFTITNSTNPTEYRLTTTSNNQDIRICNATGAGGLLFDAGNNDINVSQFNASNISADNISVTTELSLNMLRFKDTTQTTQASWFVYPTAMEIYTLNTFRIRNQAVTGSPSFIVMDTANNNVNISNLSTTNTSILNDATITRYLDRGKPRFIMLYRTSGLALTGSTPRGAIFTSNTTDQTGGEFGIANGSDVVVSTGGWYRVSFSLGFLRTSGNRITVRPYTRTKPSGGNFTFSSSKDIFGASCYMRSASLNREGYTTGTVLRYIPAGGAVQITIDCMVEGNGTFTSSFNGTNLRNQSNFMVEFVSSAAET